eukprot:m.42987 g.42987  ORF g.42987 m.42987 type:complete len:75 (+) comp14627_c0_seq1:1067-1291(+)
MVRTSVHVTRCPPQTNYCDCGFFVMWFACVRSLDASFLVTSPGRNINIVKTVNGTKRLRADQVADRYLMGFRPG